MTEPSNMFDREQAATELRRDARVSPSVAALLSAIFLAVTMVPFAKEAASGSDSRLPSLFRQDLRRYGIQIAMQEAEKHLVYDSQFAAAVRQPYQRFLIARFGEGSRTVLVGRDGFLFHRDDIAAIAGAPLLGPAFAAPAENGRDVVDELFKTILNRRKEQDTAMVQPFEDAVSVLSNFNAALNRRSIHLMLVAVPGKAMIYPDKLRARYPPDAGPPRNADYLEWRRKLVSTGIDLVDLAEPFWGAARAPGSESLFLKWDSHWSPAGVALAAAVVAERARPFLRDERRVELKTFEDTIAEPADLVALLGLKNDPALFPRRVITLTEAALPSDFHATLNAAPVLLFGDSLTGYYEMGDTSEAGRNAGFGQQLSLRLQLPVQRFVGFGAELPGVIRSTLASHPEVLTNKRVVVLEFHLNQLHAKTFSFRLFD